MKKYLVSIKNLFKYKGYDYTVLSIIFMPIVLVLAYRFGAIRVLQFLETKLTNMVNIFFPIVVLVFFSVIPLLVGFISAFVVLDETDNKVEKYFYITPLKRSGYIITRIIVQVCFSFLLDLIVLFIIDIDYYSIIELVILAFCAALEGMIISLFILNFSSNRVEGMAMGKLSGLYLAIMFIPFILKNGKEWLFMLFPSYWYGKATLFMNINTVIVCISISIIWIIILYKRFLRKIE